MSVLMSQKQPNSLVKYSSMVFQMAAVIGLFSFLGIKLDEKLNSSNQLFTIVLSLIGIAAALYLTLKDFIRPSK
jgi:predicted MFS family arabinose efflux permease